MADTARTKTALATLLADNVAGGISPQDLRDLMESVHPSYGGVYQGGTPAATTIAAADTYYVTNWNTGGLQTNTPHRFTVATSGRLTYTGEPSIHSHIACTISVSVALAAAQILHFKLAKNGTVIDSTETICTTDGTTNIQSTALHGDVMLATDDYLELFVRNETGTNDPTLERCYFFALGMFM